MNVCFEIGDIAIVMIDCYCQLSEDEAIAIGGQHQKLITKKENVLLEAFSVKKTKL